MRHEMIRPKFYIARRDTRWDVYPQQQPSVVVAHDYSGFWARTRDGLWFKSPSSYNLQREITEHECNEWTEQWKRSCDCGAQHPELCHCPRLNQ